MTQRPRREVPSPEVSESIQRPPANAVDHVFQREKLVRVDGTMFDKVSVDVGQNAAPDLHSGTGEHVCPKGEILPTK